MCCVCVVFTHLTDGLNELSRAVYNECKYSVIGVFGGLLVPSVSECISAANHARLL